MAANNRSKINMCIIDGYDNSVKMGKVNMIGRKGVGSGQNNDIDMTITRGTRAQIDVSEFNMIGEDFTTSNQHTTFAGNLGQLPTEVETKQLDENCDIDLNLISHFPTCETNVSKKLKFIEENNLDYLRKYKLLVNDKQVFNKIETSDFLGNGRFGDVFKIKFKDEIRIDKNLALKKIRLSGEQEEDERTMREVLINQSLQKNENIVRFIDYIIEIDQSNMISLNIIMELCKFNLSKWFEINPLDVREKKKSLEMLLGILKGLKFLHDQGIMHRDLKPSNIMINDKDICKIADFDLAKAMVEKFLTKADYYTIGVGTPIYAAPEQLNPYYEGKYDAKTDIFPLGCILMQFFTNFSSEEKKEGLTEALQSLRKNQKLPTSISSKYPAEAKLIINMTKLIPDQRPNVNEVISIVQFLL